MINYLQRWMDQLRWQRLRPFEELAVTLLKHLDGIANYCRTKVRMGVVEAVNGNIRMLINRGRGYKNLHYLLLKAKRLAVSYLELLAVRKSGNPRNMPLCQFLAQSAIIHGADVVLVEDDRHTAGLAEAAIGKSGFR